jgi:two-component sensor histidine kinase
MKRYALFLSVAFCCSCIFAQNDYEALTDKAYSDLAGGNVVAAKQSLEQALKVLPQQLNAQAKADFYNNLGVAYYQTGEYSKGLSAYKLSIDIYSRLANDSLLAGALLNLGLAYKEIGAFRQATENIVAAARLSERYGNRKELSSEWNALGNIQREAGNYEKALAYHWRALQIREAIGYDKGAADSYHNIGDLYLDLGRFDESEKYLLEAMKRKRRLDNRSNMVNTLSALGRLSLAKKDPAKALHYLNRAYNMRMEAGNSAKAASSLFYLGSFYESYGDRARALELFRQTQEIARISADRSLLADALQAEIGLLSDTGEKSMLVKKYSELLAVRERVVEDANHKEIARLETEYDVERKEREIEIRRKQGKLDHAQIENGRLRNQQLLAWLAGVALVALVVALALVQIRKRKRQIEEQNRELEEQRDEITDLHHELSHRTKNYFGLLSGILKSDKAQVANQEASKVLEENIRRLEAMSLVQHYLLDDSSRRNKEVNLDAYLGKLVDLIILNLFPHGSELKLVSRIESVYLDYDMAMRLAIALNELMCNAIEHALPHVEFPELSVSVRRYGTKIELVVRDNGPGIEEKHIRSGSVKGQSLIAKLLYKVDGSIQYRNDNGCVAIVGVTI